MEQMGKYQLVRRLATGGMAEVFLAKAAGPMGFEKELVVKRILPHLAEDPRFVEMFLSEAKLAARLNHGNVVQIFDFGEQDNSYFIAMEYLEGLNLKALSQRAFQRGAPISFPLVARIVSLTCEGLAYAHELLDPESGQPLGFIHRDISTDNILVSLTGGVKVVDFGIAKAANIGQQTQGGVLKGKLSYMPPEYLMGLPIDSRADIYALGVVLYELVTGRKPFVAETEVLLAQLIVHSSPPEVRTLRPDAPATLAQIIERALHKQREARYESCRQMQADLERFLFQCGEPVGALQIAELVKTLSATNGAPGRRLSREVPLVPPSAAPATSKEVTRPLRAPNPAVPPLPPPEDPAEPTVPALPPIAPDDATEKPTAPLKRSRLMSPSETEAEDEELRRLVARPRWRWPVILAVGALAALGLVVFSFSDKGAGSAEVAAPSSHVQDSPPASAPPSTRPAPPADAPPQAAPQAAVTPQANTPARSPQDAPSQPAPQGVPEKAEAVAPTPSHAPTATPPGSATLTVTSNRRAEVWIKDKRVGTTPCEVPVDPGQLTVMVTEVGHNDRFNMVKSVKISAGEHQEVSFNIRRVTVQIRGKPDDMKVLSVDGHTIPSDAQVPLYEGEHIVELVHPLTGKHYVSSCVAKFGERLCKFFVMKLQ